VKRLLVIGASGFLGSLIYRELKKSGRDVIGSSFSNKCNSELYFLDLGNPECICDFLEIVEPDVVIHAGGLTDTEYCETHKKYAFSVNVAGTKALMSNFFGKIIYFSTDYVFDGLRGSYNEKSQPNPINYYGLTKLLAEREVLGNEENLVVRLSGLYGENAANNKFMDNLRKSVEIFACDDLVSSPTYIWDIPRVIDSLFDLKGLIHLVGPESMSRYAFVSEVVDGLGLDVSVIPVKYEECHYRAKRPRDSSLTTIMGGFKMTPLGQAIERMRERRDE